MSIHDCDSRIPSLVYTTADKTSASAFHYMHTIQTIVEHPTRLLGLKCT
jgi:hypothetical protein